ncbi:MAG: GDSL-type esterase/lipase family protein [Synergistaceae bacterium]
MKKILCFGDSNTYGFVPAGRGARFDFDVRYTGVMAEILKERFVVLEEGFNGRTTIFNDYIKGRNGLERVAECITPHNPIDIFVIMLGTNDTKTKFHATESIITNGIERVIDKALTVLPPIAKIVLVAPPHLGENVWRPFSNIDFSEQSYRTARKLGPMYRELANRRNFLFLDASMIVESSKQDMVHLDTDAHKILGTALADLIFKNF